jgi:ABC-type glycerol-3-phosphate transport system substrate-binding protein
MYLKMGKTFTGLLLALIIIISGCTSGNNITPSPSASEPAKTSEPIATSETPPNDNESFTGTVKVLREWGDAQPNKAMFDALAIEFMQEYPNVKVEYVTPPGGTSSLQALVAANDSPDVVMTWGAQPNFLKDNLLEDMMPYLEKYPGTDASTFYAPSYNKYLVGDKLYGLPWNVDPNFPLVSNKQILEQYGISEVPELKTLEDLGDYLRQFWVVKEGKQEMTTFDPSSLWASGTAFMTWGFVNGLTTEEMYDPVTRKAGYNNPKLVEALEWMADFYQENINQERMNQMKATLPEGTDLFDANKSAVSFYATKKAIEEMDTIFTPMPEEGLWVGGYGFSLVATSKNKDAAFQFIKFLSSTEAAARISNDILGVVPAMSDLPFLHEKAKTNKSLAVGLEILSKVKKFPPATPVDMPETYEADLMAVITGTSNEDPQSYLDNLNKIMQQKIDDYYKQ